jgi:urea transport system permease protein
VGVNLGRSILTNHFPELWPFFLGGLFVVVVLLFPDGVMGIAKKMSEKLAVRTVRVRKTPAVEEEQA